MAESIIDGTGTGNEAKVDTNNFLHVFAVSEPEDKFSNLKGKTWSLYFTTTPVGAGDYFFYLKNTGANDLAITDIRISAATGGRTFTYEKVSGTPSYTAGADVTFAQRNLGSSLEPAATIKSDTDTTGLTSEGVIFFQPVPVADTLYHLRTSSNIIIPIGQAFAIKDDTGTALVTCNVSLTEVIISA